MSRFPLHTVDTAPAEVQPLLATAQRNSGFLPNLLAVLANAPTALETYLTVSAINARSSLSLQEREVVQLVAATTNGCTFCVAGHTAVATRKAELPAEVIAALRDGGIMPDARYAALARFTLAVIHGRGQVADDDFATFLAAGFSPANALDVVLGVSLASLCNYANNLARTPLNPELSAFQWQGRQ